VRPAKLRALGRIEDATARRRQAIEQLSEIVTKMRRYELALRRIAESDEVACPHVKVALEALNP
jgi:hypothetical protein